MKTFLLTTTMILASAAAVTAAPVEYVKVCDSATYGGDGFFYLPGTDTCVNPDTGETKRITADGVVTGTTALADRIEELEQRFKDAHEGVAVGMAIPIAQIAPQHNFAFAMNWGGFDGSNALGAGGAIRLNENFTFTGGVGVGLEQGVVGGRAGFNLSW